MCVGIAKAGVTVSMALSSRAACDAGLRGLVQPAADL